MRASFSLSLSAVFKVKENKGSFHLESMKAQHTSLPTFSFRNLFSSPLFIFSII